MSKVFAYGCETWAVALVFLSGGLLFGALIMEHVFEVAPCPLCLMQRIWFFVAGAFAYASLLHNPRWGIYPLFSLREAPEAGVDVVPRNTASSIWEAFRVCIGPNSPNVADRLSVTINAVPAMIRPTAFTASMPPTRFRCGRRFSIASLTHATR